jgi:3',5'-cyclic AMP phosphodiesterase CpdA
MMFYFQINRLIFFFSILVLSYCSVSLPIWAAEGSTQAASNTPQKIAFMPDIHFHDIYATFKDHSFSGLKNSVSGKNATIRTLAAELNSTRLFNENYFALLAALDDVATRGIKLVALPGDFSDDGQPIHLRGLVRILNHYRTQYGMRFFATPGNHDPVRPFDLAGGESDFLGVNGHPQRIYSKGAKECISYTGPSATIKTEHALDTICSEDVRHLGYLGVMTLLADFGFNPQENDHYWETPYSDYKVSSYSFSKAQLAAQYEQRQYEICHQGMGGKHKKSDYTACSHIADASYLVEPVEGLWLLAIDANVYIPKDKSSPLTNNDFSGSGNAGYNKLLSHKGHVIDWIKQVVVRAKNQGKKLIAFSHFPMTEFYDGQSDDIAQIFGKDNFQLARKPEDKVSHVLADTGIKLHVGGHMHINDTGMTHSANGQFLFNIQAPSIAAYVPAYKLMTIHNNSQIEIDTVVLDDVPRFSELFEHYQQEYAVLSQSKDKKIWNKEILDSQTYREFTNWHISELTRQRFLPQEWPKDIRDILLAFNGQELLILSQLNSQFSLKDLQNSHALDILKLSGTWGLARDKAFIIVSNSQLDWQYFSSWNGFDLAVDFYRLRNAGQLALRDISTKRLQQYQFFSQLMINQSKGVPHFDTLATKPMTQPLSQLVVSRFSQLFNLLEGFKQGLPDDHFMLNIDSGAILPLPLNN